MPAGVSAGREVRRQFWLLLRAGVVRKQAAVAVGLNADTGRDWFRQAGGVVPAFVTAPTRGRFLSFTEREEIFAGVERGDAIRLMAKRLSRAPSTVFRELRRNMRHPIGLGFDRPRGVGRGRGPGTTDPAGRSGGRSAGRPDPSRPSWPRTGGCANSSKPNCGSGSVPGRWPSTCARSSPTIQSCRSHEAIYQSIYVQGRGALRRELAVYLRTGRALRRPRRTGEPRQARIPGMVNISERPAEVEDRAVPGHWEGDLILGKPGRSAIGTLVERSTRFVMLLHLPERHGPEEVQAAMIAATKRLPRMIWKSLT